MESVHGIPETVTVNVLPIVSVGVGVIFVARPRV